MAYFTKVEWSYIPDSFAGGLFSAFVPPEQCAEKCLSDSSCKSFSVDRAGGGLCMISYEDRQATGYTTSSAFDFYERRGGVGVGGKGGGVFVVWQVESPSKLPSNT